MNNTCIPLEYVGIHMHNNTVTLDNYLKYMQHMYNLNSSTFN